MNNPNHHEKSLGFLPTQGRGARPVLDHRLKVKARRHERRKCREAIRIWLGEGPEA